MTTPEPPLDHAEPTPSPWWLAFRVIDEPAAVFRHLAVVPRVLVPIVLLIASTIVSAAVMPEAGLRRMAEQRADAMAEQAGDEFTEEDRQEMLEDAASTQARVLIAVSGSVGGVLWLVIVAAVLLLIMGALGSEPLRFKDELAIVTHAFVPGMLGGVLLLLLMRLTGLEEIQLSLGFLFDPETSAFLHGFAGGVSLFGVWTVLLLALGNQIRTKTKSLNTPLMVVGSLWVVLLLIRAGLTTVFGSFG